jgi:hypothetical protein
MESLISQALMRSILLRFRTGFPRWAAWTLGLLAVPLLILIGIDLWTGAHGFFLLWFFGLKADD